MKRPWTFWVFCGFAVVGAYYLITEHRDHVFDYLPYALLVACPLLHVFHGPGGHGHKDRERTP